MASSHNGEDWVDGGDGWSEEGDWENVTLMLEDGYIDGDIKDWPTEDADMTNGETKTLVLTPLQYPPPPSPVPPYAPQEIQPFEPLEPLPPHLAGYLKSFFGILRKSLNETEEEVLKALVIDHPAISSVRFGQIKPFMIVQAAQDYMPDICSIYWTAMMSLGMGDNKKMKKGVERCTRALYRVVRTFGASCLDGVNFNLLCLRLLGEWEDTQPLAEDLSALVRFDYRQLEAVEHFMRAEHQVRHRDRQVILNELVLGFDNNPQQKSPLRTLITSPVFDAHMLDMILNFTDPLCVQTPAPSAHEAEVGRLIHNILVEE